jgi:hypothetical protein
MNLYAHRNFACGPHRTLYGSRLPVRPSLLRAAAFYKRASASPGQRPPKFFADSAKVLIICRGAPPHTTKGALLPKRWEQSRR